MSYKKIALLIIVSGPAALQASYTRVRSSLFASAIGDALGRVTEFIPSTKSIFERYPQGVRSFKDFKESDWSLLPQYYKAQGIAPYTDDTRMALLVTEVLISAKQREWSKETTMSELAKAFIKDLDEPYGWAAGYRAPGNACLKGVHLIKNRTAHKTGWWNAHASEAGGCGSVMRTFPFGLVFWHNPTKAVSWAVEHSKITHSHPIALAACAAMALGTALAVDGNRDPESIIQAMIVAAEKYDVGTAQKMRKALAYAHQARELLYNSSIRAQTQYHQLHEKVFAEFEGWAAHDAIAATVYVFAVCPRDLSAALFISVHTQGDSDSIAAMSGALVGAYSGIAPDAHLVRQIEHSKEIDNLARSAGYFLKKNN